MAKVRSREIIENVRDILIKELKAAGFKIMLYESTTTNSIYLKLDYGVMHSIRISDHEGKKHLQYRYNVLTTVTGFDKRKSPQGWERFYYSPYLVGELIKVLKSRRSAKIMVMGEKKKRYQNEMLNHRQRNSGSKGFWSQAREV